jgi:lipid A disaccharide synthetase
MRRWVQTRWIGLVNIVAQADLALELIQDQATPHRVSQELERLLENTTAYQENRSRLATIAKSLSREETTGEEGGASQRAAKLIYQHLLKTVET